MKTSIVRTRGRKTIEHDRVDAMKRKKPHSYMGLPRLSSKEEPQQ